MPNTGRKRTIPPTKHSGTARREWFLAELVMELVIEGERRNVVHINQCLVEAGSPAEAHKRALDLGRQGQHRYLNTDGRRVREIFRGLRDLNRMHDDPAHGAEVSFEEHFAVPQATLKQWVRPKRDLGLFAPRRPGTDLPNYFPMLALRMLEEQGYTLADVLTPHGGTRGNRTRSAVPAKKRKSTSRGRA